MNIRPIKCEKCGKKLSLFEGKICLEGEEKMTNDKFILVKNPELIDRKVIEDIKADIIRHSKICDPEFKDAFEVTVQIIDKHIGK